MDNIKIENDIECVVEENYDQPEDINFDLMTRYYQILLSQIENSSGEYKVKKGLYPERKA